MTFLKKLTNVLNDPNTDDSILTWSPSGESFLINVKRLSDSPYMKILCSNAQKFGSFRKQLNLRGIYQVGKDNCDMKTFQSRYEPRYCRESSLQMDQCDNMSNMETDGNLDDDSLSSGQNTEESNINITHVIRPPSNDHDHEAWMKAKKLTNTGTGTYTYTSSSDEDPGARGRDAIKRKPKKATGRGKKNDLVAALEAQLNAVREEMKVLTSKLHEHEVLLSLGQKRGSSSDNKIYRNKIQKIQQMQQGQGQAQGVLSMREFGEEGSNQLWANLPGNQWDIEQEQPSHPGYGCSDLNNMNILETGLDEPVLFQQEIEDLDLFAESPSGSPRENVKLNKLIELNERLDKNPKLVNLTLMEKHINFLKTLTGCLGPEESLDEVEIRLEVLDKLDKHEPVINAEIITMVSVIAGDSEFAYPPSSSSSDSPVTSVTSVTSENDVVNDKTDSELSSSDSGEGSVYSGSEAEGNKDKTDNMDNRDKQVLEEAWKTTVNAGLEKCFEEMDGERFSVPFKFTYLPAEFSLTFGHEVVQFYSQKKTSMSHPMIRLTDEELKCVLEDQAYLKSAESLLGTSHPKMLMACSLALLSMRVGLVDFCMEVGGTMETCTMIASGSYNV